MPCRDDGYPHTEERPTKAELKAMLCDFCTYVQDSVGSEPYRWPEHIRLWWEAHQIEDAKRKQREAASKEAHKAHLRKLRAEINAELGDD